MNATRQTQPDDDAQPTNDDGPRGGPVPQDWVDHGHDEPAQPGEVRLYAVQARLNGGTLLVRYVTGDAGSATVRRFDAHAREEGVIPFCVARDGPDAFPATITDSFVGLAVSDAPVRDDDEGLLRELHDLDPDAERERYAVDVDGF